MKNKVEHQVSANEYDHCYDDIFNIQYFKNLENGINLEVVKKIINDNNFIKINKLGAETLPFERYLIVCDLIKDIETLKNFFEILNYLKTIEFNDKTKFIFEKEKFDWVMTYSKSKNFLFNEYLQLLVIYCSYYFGYIVLKYEFAPIFESNKISFPDFKFEINEKDILQNFDSIKRSCYNEYLVNRTKFNSTLNDQERITDINNLIQTFNTTNLRAGNNKLKEPIKYLNDYKKTIQKFETKNTTNNLTEEEKIYSEIFSNNGFKLFEYLLDEFITKKRGRFADISFYYWKMYKNKPKYIHQNPEVFRLWFCEKYDEEFSKIKTLTEVNDQKGNRNRNYSSALNLFKTKK